MHFTLFYGYVTQLWTWYSCNNSLKGLKQFEFPAKHQLPRPKMPPSGIIQWIYALFGGLEIAHFIHTCVLGLGIIHDFIHFIPSSRHQPSALDTWPGSAKDAAYVIRFRLHPRPSLEQRTLFWHSQQNDNVRCICPLLGHWWVWRRMS